MLHLQEKFQINAGRLHNVTIANHTFKILPVYDCAGKVKKVIFNTYKDSLT